MLLVPEALACILYVIAFILYFFARRYEVIVSFKNEDGEIEDEILTKHFLVDNASEKIKEFLENKEWSKNDISLRIDNAWRKNDVDENGNSYRLVYNLYKRKPRNSCKDFFGEYAEEYEIKSVKTIVLGETIVEVEDADMALQD